MHVFGKADVRTVVLQYYFLGGGTVGRNGKICAMCLLRVVMFTDKIPRLEAALFRVLPLLF